MDCLKIGKVVCQPVYRYSAYKLYADYIMWNARLDQSHARIKFDRRNINNLRYVDDTTLMAESEEELKNLLIRVKEESEKSGLKSIFSVSI